MKKIILCVCLLLLGAPFWAVAGDYTRHNALEIKQTEGDDYENRDFFRIKEKTGVTVIYRVDPGGNLTIADPASGVTQQQILITGAVTRKPYVKVDLAGTSIYTVDPANGSVFFIDDHESQDGTRDTDSGVSLALKTITEAMDGACVKIVKQPRPFSGTTVVVISTERWSSGVTDHIWNQGSGVTYELSNKEPPEIYEIDAVGDYLEFTAEYNASGSTWWQTDRYIQ